MKRQFLIAAASSGAGKTTLTMGILRALARRGLRVQPFKCGPDYIDTQFHAIAARAECSVNLDTWMQGDEGVRQYYYRYAREADAVVVEGVMGLFDGYSRDRGSSAEVARLLDLPVVLVVSAQSTAYSVAPLLYGFRRFDRRLRLAGVVFNQVASVSHAAFLRDAAADAGVACLGCVLRDARFAVPSRHLGLTLAARSQMDALADSVADAVEQAVDLDTLLRLGGGLPRTEACAGAAPPAGGGLVAVAADEAFSFCYRTTLDALATLGRVVRFSPLADEAVPPEASAVYLPGGYPELFLPRLERSAATVASLRALAARRTPIVAECGGMMYLGTRLVDADGGHHPMAGLLPLTTTMAGARLHLGYRCADLSAALGAGGGGELRGHEFHYSRLAETSLPSVGRQTRPGGQPVDTLLMRHGSILAGYTHWHWTPSNLRTVIRYLSHET